MHGPITAAICAAIFTHGCGDAGQYAVKRAAPATMRGTDNAVLCVSQQNRRAIGGQCANGEAAPCGDQRIGFYRFLRCIDEIGHRAVRLISGGQCRRAQMQAHAVAVFQYARARIVRAEAGIQAFI